MQPTTNVPPTATTPLGGGGAPAGASPRMMTRYFDEHGLERRARDPVPVDQYGVITSVQYRCPKCKATEWVSRAVAAKGTPACKVDNRRMERLGVKAPPLLPWRAIWRAADKPLRAVWVGAGTGLAGVAADSAGVPTLASMALAVPAGLAARAVTERKLIKRAAKRDPELAAWAKDKETKHADLVALLGQRKAETISRRARMIGYCATAGCGWVALAAAAGTDPHGGGAVTWPALVATWAYPAFTWWKHVRDQRRQPAPELELTPEVEGPPPVDPNEAQTRRIWSTIVAVQKGQVIGKTAEGHEILAPRNGKLVGTQVEDWHKVAGGWGLTAVGPDGVYVADNFVAARGAVASAFRMKTSMITCIPDADDENRALYLAQRTSPIADVVRWSGPGSIDVRRGVAPVALYCDGELVLYEMYRPEWGVPHVVAFGSTGSGKSEFLCALFAIDRWAHYVNAAGRPRGIVANFLIDPQQGQSFAPFIDDLAAPVACSLDEALLLVRALTEEGLRRNRYLSRVEWVDPKRGKKRRGRKWWNPLIDGPILSLTIDEAHDYLSNREFCTLVTKAGRMWRKCGMQVRIATHTPLLADLGGSMALRDMLTGCFVWVGRTANSLSGPVAFNGRLPVDPRTIPAIPGMAYILTGLQPKPMLARTMWVPDYYDWVRDNDDQPIGYPAVLPPETLAAFGPEYARWVAAHRSGDGLWTPEPVATKAEPTLGGVRCIDAVLSQLACAPGPMDMDALDAALRRAGVQFSTRTVRGALEKLRGKGLVFSAGSPQRHELTPQAREDIEGQVAAKFEEAALRDAEGGEPA